MALTVREMARSGIGMVVLGLFGLTLYAAAALSWVDTLQFGTLTFLAYQTAIIVEAL